MLVLQNRPKNLRLQGHMYINHQQWSTCCSLQGRTQVHFEAVLRLCMSLKEHKLLPDVIIQCYEILYKKLTSDDQWWSRIFCHLLSVYFVYWISLPAVSSQLHSLHESFSKHISRWRHQWCTEGLLYRSIPKGFWSYVIIQLTLTFDNSSRFLLPI